MKNFLLALTVLGLMLLIQPAASHAANISIDFGWAKDRPSRAVVVDQGRHHNYGRRYHNDNVHRAIPRDYSAVRLPVGTRLRYIPYGHERVRVHGRNYFRHHGVYYVASHNGYMVVHNPYVIVVQQPGFRAYR